jgi:hypothetical protein
MNIFMVKKAWVRRQHSKSLELLFFFNFVTTILNYPPLTECLYKKGDRFFIHDVISAIDEGLYLS